MQQRNDRQDEAPRCERSMLSFGHNSKFPSVHLHAGQAGTRCIGVTLAYHPGQAGLQPLRCQCITADGSALAWPALGCTNGDIVLPCLVAKKNAAISTSSPGLPASPSDPSGV
eukprot:1160517-Pelagomonas_calceolata.AAC.20